METVQNVRKHKCTYIRIYIYIQTYAYIDLWRSSISFAVMAKEYHPQTHAHSNTHAHTNIYIHT